MAQRAPISTTTIVVIEMWAGGALAYAATAAFPHGNELPALLLGLAGLAALASIPFTCGFLWHGPRTGKYERVLTRIGGPIIVVACAAGAAITYPETHRVDTVLFVIPPLTYVLFFAGRALGRRPGEDASTPQDREAG